MASTGSQTLTDTLAAEAPPSCARALSDSNLGEGRKTWRGVVSSGYMGEVWPINSLYMLEQLCCHNKLLECRKKPISWQVALLNLSIRWGKTSHRTNFTKDLWGVSQVHFIQQMFQQRFRSNQLCTQKILFSNKTNQMLKRNTDIKTNNRTSKDGN